MAANDKSDEFRLGFLTAVAIADRGHVGGLLVTNRFGRPLEFQCTSPVQPNRTQEILYGPTLMSFLLGELIGRTLAEKVAVKPHLILVDREEFLELRQHASIPVALIVDEPDDRESPASRDEASSTVRLGRQTVRIDTAHESELDAFRRQTEHVPSDADLREPFERIEQALQETLGMKAAG